MHETLVKIQRRDPIDGRSQRLRRRVRSDWMAVDQRRHLGHLGGDSFEHEGLAFNLLDTPGHQDFSEDTYRALTAVAMLNAINNDHPKIARFVSHIQRW